MIKNKYPNYYPMSQVIDGAETTTFKAIFSDWWYKLDQNNALKSNKN